ncbi:MAG: hypothetical protein AAGF31_10970 [Planctomycetota bacterium]
MNRKFRTRLLVDTNLQGALLCRVMLYWCVCVGMMVMLAGLQAAWSNSDAGWPVVLNRAMLAFGPSLIAATVLLPVLLFDSLRFSIRFAGPMKRLRNEARRLADGQDVAPIKFRDGDYWGDLADEFNRLSEELRRLRNERDVDLPEAVAAVPASQDAEAVEASV